MDNKTNLEQIRNVFPDWPSELEAAKVPAHWASLAQAFYCAARVLNEEATAAHQEMHKMVGQKIEECNFMRQQTMIPADFCLAFTLELAIKSPVLKVEEWVEMDFLITTHQNQSDIE